MGLAGVSALIEAAADGGGGWDSLLTNVNFPGVALIAASGIVGMVFVIRWMIRFQREFTDFYVAENQKLRTRVETLEAETQAKDDKITELKIEVGRVVRRCEDHEATIARLNRIIERRQLEREGE